MEAVCTSETSVDNHFTWHYNPEDSSEHHTLRRENLKSHKESNNDFTIILTDCRDYPASCPAYTNKHCLRVTGDICKPCFSWRTIQFLTRSFYFTQDQSGEVAEAGGSTSGEEETSKKAIRRPLFSVFRGSKLKSAKVTCPTSYDSHACCKRQLKWVPSAWGYSWANLSPGVINMEAWSSRLGVGCWTNNPAM
jgi:hypothetical protein